jgi:hypothetical protein
LRAHTFKLIINLFEALESFFQRIFNLLNYLAVVCDTSDVDALCFLKV